MLSSGILRNIFIWVLLRVGRKGYLHILNIILHILHILLHILYSSLQILHIILHIMHILILAASLPNPSAQDWLAVVWGVGRPGTVPNHDAAASEQLSHTWHT
jgi:hypothetical protein